MKKCLVTMAFIIAFSFVFTSCNNKKADYVDDGTANIDFTDKGGLDVDSTKNSNLYGLYTYPDNPVEELRSYLENHAKEHGLPLEISDIERVKKGRYDRMEFIIYFTSNRENACVVSFATKSEDTTFDYYSLDGKENPSFTIAFKDPYKSQDMITVLTSILTYLSSDLDLKEAERLAIKQDDTISIDGYSTPLDIGGYQVQTHYTNPYDYFTTNDFTAKLGVTVKALKQIWEGEININNCQKLSDEDDFWVLNHPQSLLDDDNKTSRIVYADFIVKDWWEYQEPVHGDFTTFVTVESPYGKEYELILDPMRTPYEFGIGEKYTIFIYYHYGEVKISYAIQQTEGE